jgi:hypothetical protein
MSFGHSQEEEEEEEELKIGCWHGRHLQVP